MDDFPVRYERFQRFDAGTSQDECAIGKSLPTERVVICSIVQGEIRYGIERLAQGKRRQALEAKAAKLFAAILDSFG